LFCIAFWCEGPQMRASRIIIDAGLPPLTPVMILPMARIS
jgi:hypothetical protein